MILQGCVSRMVCELSLKAIKKMNELLLKMIVLRSNFHVHISRVFLILIVSSSTLPTILYLEITVLTLPSILDNKDAHSYARTAISL